MPASSTADRVYLANRGAIFDCDDVALNLDTTGLSGNVSGLTIVQVARTSGGISGTFSSVTANNGYLATVHYNTQTITLDLCLPAGPPTGSALQTFWSGDNPTVADLQATGNSIQWYAVSSGGSALSPSTPLVNNTHYYASQTVGDCESVARLDVTATVNTPLLLLPPGLPGGQLTLDWAGNGGCKVRRC